MANPELGAKQICPNCQTKFYDLTKRPAHCPKCGFEFDPEEALKSRRVRARTTARDFPDDEPAEKPVRDEDAEAFEEEADATPEIDEAADEPDPAATDDDDEAAEPGAEPAEADPGLGVDFDEEADIEEEADDDVPFLEDEDDDLEGDDIVIPGEEEER